MKSIVSIVLFFVIGFSAAAQTNLPAVNEGQPIEMGKHAVTPMQIAYSDEKGYLLVGISDGDLAIQRVNNDLSVGEATVIDNRTAADEVLRYSGCQVFNNKLCIFWVLEKTKTNKFTLLYQLADLLSGKAITEKTILLVADTYPDEVLPVSYIESDYNNYFRSALSKDRKKLLVLFSSDSTGQSENQTYSIHVFDSLFHSLKQTSYTFPIKHNQYLLKDIKINNDGDVAFSGIETIDGHSVKGYASEFPYMRPVGMFHVTLLQQNGSVQDRTIKLDKKLITDVAFNMGKHSLQVMGFWSDVVDYSNKISMDLDRWYCKGSFFQNFDYATTDPIVNTNSSFSQQLITDCDIWVAPRQSDVQRRKREVFTLTAQEILTLSNGDYVLMSEQLTEYTPTAIYSGNIIASRYAPGGDFMYTTNLPRYEIISQPRPAYIYTQDYICYTKEESICIIYSKNVQSVAYRMAEKHNEPSMQKNIPESSIIFAEINADGRLNCSLLKDVKGESFFKLIQSCSYVNAAKSTVMLVGTDFSNYWFVSAKY